VRRSLDAFLAERAADPEVLAASEAIAREGGAASLAEFRRQHAGAHALEAEVLRRMDADDKSTGLKQLQGLIWRAGYERGELRGHVYPDVPVAFAAWVAQGADIRIYSSGSVEAQRLLFTHSVAGPLAGHIRILRHRTGPKRRGKLSANVLEATILPACSFSDITEGLGTARESNSLPFSCDEPRVLRLPHPVITHSKARSDSESSGH
jgi:enolase-phosphatase E1